LSNHTLPSDSCKEMRTNRVHRLKLTVSFCIPMILAVPSAPLSRFWVMYTSIMTGRTLLTMTSRPLLLVS
jgi:hypothetical protein